MRHGGSAGRPSAVVPTRLLAAWDDFWFGEAPLVRLGLFRIVVLATALWGILYYAGGVEQHARGAAPSFLQRPWRPIFVFEVLGIGPLDSEAFDAVSVLLFVAIGMGIAGLFTRLACLAAALLTFLWVGTFYSFGKPHHDFVALMFALLALPFSPAGARVSLDAAIARWRRRRRGLLGGLAERDAAPAAALPLRLTQVSIAIGYFFAGATKLVRAGPDWANGYTLQGMMLEFDAPWTAFFASRREILVLLSAATLVFQTTFPLVLLWPRLRWFYLPAAALFHVVSWKTMSTGPYVTLWFLLASYVDLERIPATVGRLLARGGWPVRVLRGLVLSAVATVLLLLYFRHVPLWVGASVFAFALAAVAMERARARQEPVAP
jgi:hypothetical protein